MLDKALKNLQINLQVKDDLESRLKALLADYRQSKEELASCKGMLDSTLAK